MLNPFLPVRHSAASTWESKEPETWSWQETLGYSLQRHQSVSFFIWEKQINGATILNYPDPKESLLKLQEELQLIQSTSSPYKEVLISTLTC